MPKNYFFDYASCTPIDPDILKTYNSLNEKYFVNSEAVYSKGLEVNKLVETSREKIAKLLDVNSDELIFNSGASEANSFAIKGFAFKNKHKGKHIITSKMEHSSVLNTLKQLEEYFDFDVDYLDVDSNGQVSLEKIKQYLRSDTIMVCLMHVNNEIGSIQDIDNIGKFLRSKRICFMVDGVQAIGKIPVSLKNVDLYVFTTHKLYGIKGCGILYKRRNIELLPLVLGGQQERGLRGGTLNAPACIVAAKTLRLALDHMNEHYNIVKNYNMNVRDALKDVDDLVINSPVDAIPYILNVSCTALGSEIMMNALNARGICISSQSTCSSRTSSPSHTLKAMGKSDDIAYGVMRFSFSHLNNEEEVNYLTSSIKEIINEYKTR